MSLRVIAALSLLLALSSCGSADEDERPAPTPPPEPAAPEWLPSLGGSGLPQLELGLRVEIRGGLHVVDATRDNVVPTAAAAVQNARRGTVLVLAAPTSTRADAVWPLVEAAFEAGVEDVRLAATQGGQPVYQTLRRFEWPDPAPGDATLNLALTLTPAGTVVAGSGGRLAPGCEVTQTGHGVTVPIGAEENAEVTACLARVKAEFPNESTVTILTDPDVPIVRVLAVLLAARGERGELFAHALFGRDSVSDAAIDELLAGAMGVGVAERAVDSETPSERAIRGAVRAGTLEDESGSGVFDPNLVVREIRRRIGDIQSCYETHLSRNPTLAGRVLVEITIQQETGIVLRSLVRENSTSNTGVGSCFSVELEQMRFDPGPEGGDVTYVFPFVVAPQS